MKTTYDQNTLLLSTITECHYKVFRKKLLPAIIFAVDTEVAEIREKQFLHLHCDVVLA